MAGGKSWPKVGVVIVCTVKPQAGLRGGLRAEHSG